MGSSRRPALLKSVLCDQMGFKCIYSDNSIYVLRRNSDYVIVPVFVDDGTLASNCMELVESTVASLSQHFKLRDLGDTSFLLGIQITRNRSERRLELSQRQYIVDMLKRYNMADCNTVTTPLVPGNRLSIEDCPKTPEEHQRMANVPYGSAVGSLLYLTTSTRPDISFTVSQLCRFIPNPGLSHWKAVHVEGAI